MNGRQTRKAIKEARAVQAWVQTSSEDGVYIQVSKSAAMSAFPPCEDFGDFGDIDYIVAVRGDQVFIN